jgi:hypothetical protein
VKRIYKPEDDAQREAAQILESIFQRNRIDSVNIERGNMLFAGCEVMTLWYAVEAKNTFYGVASPLKIRCRSFSPMKGENLYPLFDEFGDYIAMSVECKVKKGGKTITYFDTYTESRHIKWESVGESWQVVEDEEITIEKNPTIYMYRPAPIWEDHSKHRIRARVGCESERELSAKEQPTGLDGFRG